jgi:hypothetical protein
MVRFSIESVKRHSILKSERLKSGTQGGIYGNHSGEECEIFPFKFL